MGGAAAIRMHIANTNVKLSWIVARHVGIITWVFYDARFKTEKQKSNKPLYPLGFLEGLYRKPMRSSSSTKYFFFFLYFCFLLNRNLYSLQPLHMKSQQSRAKIENSNSLIDDIKGIAQKSNPLLSL